jgi:hypothetical protein
MKKYVKFVILVTIVATVISCDSYLDTKSPSVFTEETSFANIDFAQKVLTGAYYNLTSVYLYGAYSLYYNSDNDIEFNVSANNGSSTSLAHYSATPGTNTFTNIWWNLFYSTIERANICIDNLPKSPLWEGQTAGDARRIYGQAVTLRAWSYYELIKLFGDVPFKVRSTQASDEYIIPKTDRDSIYEYLIQDLKDVEDLVPWMGEIGTAEHIGKGFVKGLRARMALAYAGYSLRNTTHETRRGRYWQDYYKIANQECKEIMESGQHGLNPSFENIFKTILSYSQDLTNKEVLFEIAFGRLNTGRIGYDIGMTYGYSPVSAKYGRGLNTIKSSAYYFYSFDRKDIRRNVSTELYKYGVSGKVDVQTLLQGFATDFGHAKWRKSWIVPAMGGDLQLSQFTGVNWPLMRYADVVLMFAETENEINGGPTQAAKDALSLIRQRAFKQDSWASKVTHYVDSVSAGKESFFNAIVDERAWEFGGEMIRKGDLVRWNLLGSKISQMKEETYKIVNNDPKYANLVPDYIYWKTEADGETINILNPDYRLPNTTIAGYTKAAWLPLMSTAARTQFDTYFNNIANGYDATKNNHLYPIDDNILISSNGILTNDQLP